MKKNSSALTLLIFVFTASFIIGCSSTRPPVAKPPQAQPAAADTSAEISPPPVETITQQQAEETSLFDPLEIADDSLLKPKPARAVPEVPPPIAPPPDTATISEPDTLEVWEEQERQGYRVQIFTAGNHEKAREVEQTASMQFSEKVYVTYDPPLYKIRVGDCLNKAEADEIRLKAISIGYRDAWVVRDKIIIKVKME